MKWLNHKYFWPTLIVIILLLIIRIFFLDGWIKSVIAKELQAGFGAKVSISSCHLSITGGHLRLKNIQIGDKAHPMQNLVQIGLADFDMGVVALLSAQVDIQNAQLSDMAFHTPRKYSALLPVKKPKPAKKHKPSIVEKVITQQVQNQTEYYSVDALSGRLDVKEWLKSPDIRIMSVISDTVATLNAWPASVTQVINSPDIGQSIAKAQKNFDDLSKKQPQSAADVQQYLALLDSLRKSMADVSTQFSDKQKALQQKMDVGNQTIKAVNTQAALDLKHIQEKIQWMQSKKDRLIQDLIGPRTIAFIDDVRSKLVIIQKLFPKKKQTQPSWVKQWLVKGSNIDFPIYYHRPRFLLENASVSGVIKGQHFEGSLAELASDQNVRNKPTVFRVQVRDLGSGCQQILSGLMDFRGNKQRFLVQFQKSGYPLSSTYWDPAQLPLEIVAGSYKLSSMLDLNQSGYTAEADIDVTGLAFKTNAHFSADNLVHNFYAQTAAQMHAAALTLAVENGQITVNTTLDKQISAGLSSLMDKQKAVVMTQLQKQWDDQVGSQIRNMLASVTQTSTQLNKQWLDQKAVYQSQLDKLNAQIVQKQKDMDAGVKSLAGQLKNQAGKFLPKSIPNFPFKR